MAKKKSSAETHLWPSFASVSGARFRFFHAHFAVSDCRTLPYVVDYIEAFGYPDMQSFGAKKKRLWMDDTIYGVRWLEGNSVENGVFGVLER